MYLGTFREVKVKIQYQFHDVYDAVARIKQLSLNMGAK